MAEALRPMSTGELLDRTFTVYKRNFALFAMIAIPAAIIVLLTQFGQLWTLRGSLVAVQHPVQAAGAGAILSNMGRFVWAWGISMIAWIIGFSVTYAATTRAVSAVHLERNITVGQSFRGLPYVRVLMIVFCWIVLLVVLGIGVGLVTGIVVGLAVAGGAALGLVGKVIGGVIGVAAAVGAMVLVVWILARYSLAVQACVVEGKKVFASLRRSTVLAKGSIGRIVTVYILFLVIKIAVGAAGQFGATLLAVAIHSVWFIFGVQSVVAFAVAVLVSPLVAVAMSLVYYDERVRKEAFDLQLMMAALDGPAANAAASAS